MTQNETHLSNSPSQVTLSGDEEKCFCDKKQCMLGLASIAIGIGGFVLASLL